MNKINFYIFLLLTTSIAIVKSAEINLFQYNLEGSGIWSNSAGSSTPWPSEQELKQPRHENTTESTIGVNTTTQREEDDERDATAPLAAIANFNFKETARDFSSRNGTFISQTRNRGRGRGNSARGTNTTRGRGRGKGSNPQFKGRGRAAVLLAKNGETREKEETRRKARNSFSHFKGKAPGGTESWRIVEKKSTKKDLENRFQVLKIDSE